jgi:mannosyl-oligosaccharide alpha-1,2-mannosidase
MKPVWVPHTDGSPPGCIECVPHESKPSIDLPEFASTLRYPVPPAEEARAAVITAFTDAFEGYRKYAWGFDELRPMSRKGKDWFGLGLTIIDALSTATIMKLDKIRDDGIRWVLDNLNLRRDFQISVFETNIRVLGGLLSVAQLNDNHPELLQVAQDVAELLGEAVDDRSGLPWPAYNPLKRAKQEMTWHRNTVVLSEVGTLQMEYASLGVVTNRTTLAKRFMHMFALLDEAPKTTTASGLYSNWISFYPNSPSRTSGQFVQNSVSFGALGDSFYEYLLKAYVWSGKKFDRLRRMYDETAVGAREHLIRKSGGSYPDGNLTFIGEYRSGRFAARMDHLACFSAGMFAYGSQHLEGHQPFLQTAAELAYTCYRMYAHTPTGLPPEAAAFGRGGISSAGSGSNYYLLRPEAAEAFFYMWRITHDQRFRDMGWQVFQAIQEHCKVEGVGYAGVKDVYKKPVIKDDTQQTFLFAETFKYLFLLFSDDDVIPLDDYVFNTEAHPFPVPRGAAQQATLDDLLAEFRETGVGGGWPSASTDGVSQPAAAKPGRQGNGGGRASSTAVSRGWRPVVEGRGLVSQQDIELVGCFRDSADDRDLPLLVAERVHSPQQCVAKCASRAMPLAGIQAGGECWCGSAHGRLGASTACNKDCQPPMLPEVGTDALPCGGEWANSVYKLT